MRQERFSSEPFAERLRQMVAQAKIEVIPSDKILERVDLIPKTAKLSVTASPTKEIEETLEICSKLKEKGFKVIPHLAARRIRNYGQLSRIADFLDSNEISEIFVIGGDGEPFGNYSNSYNFLNDLLELNHSITEIGVSGYPEGHPLIDNETIMSFLRAKVDIASSFGVKVHVNSQACYDPEDVTNWLKTLRENHVSVPVYLGISAPMNLIKLAQTSKEIGVGDSVAFLKMVGLDGALKSAMYSPDPLLTSLMGRPDTEQIKGLHLFTFNHIKASMEWQQNFKS